MDPPVLLNERHIFILAQHEAFLKWRGPYYYCGRQTLARSAQRAGRRTVGAKHWSRGESILARDG